MTIKELIDELKKYPKDSEVMLQFKNYSYDNYGGMTTEKVISANIKDININGDIVCVSTYRE